MALFLARSLLFAALALPFLLLCNALALAAPGSRRLRFVLTRAFGRAGLALWGVRLRARGPGLPALLDGGPKVVVANHQDSLDALLVAAMLPPGAAALGKTGLLAVPLFGTAFWLLGHVLVDRGDRERARRSMERVRRLLAERGGSVWIMPEGTRSRGRSPLLPFKRGAFALAARAGAPVVPVVFGLYKGGPGAIDLGRWRSGSVAAEVLPPVPTAGVDEDGVSEDGVDEDGVDALRDRVRGAMLERLVDASVGGGTA